MKAKISLCPNLILLTTQDGRDFVFRQSFEKRVSAKNGIYYVPVDVSDQNSMHNRCARYCKENDIEVENLNCLTEHIREYFK